MYKIIYPQKRGHKSNNLNNASNYNQSAFTNEHEYNTLTIFFNFYLRNDMGWTAYFSEFKIMKKTFYLIIGKHAQQHALKLMKFKQKNTGKEKY